jgi:predicted lipoprotein with Yx(FWY)xxD motif
LFKQNGEECIMFKLRSVVLLLGLLALVALPALAQEYTVSLGHSDTLGDYLVGPNGMTLYMFDPDPLDQTVCYDQCAKNWPPLTVESADGLTADEGIPGELTTIERTDGTLQVAYNGVALYYWIRDEKPGDTTGNYVGKVWWIVPPATVYVQHNTALGSVLVGPTGMTLYRFTNDEPGVSNCADQCATNWPPLTVESADAIVPGVNLPGEWGTVERADGTIQVTYNGWPLYYWKDDKARGDMTGEGVGDKWYTIPQETVAVSNSSELGDYLTAANGLTLYTFKKDTAGVSNCADDCAKNWPPFTVGKTAHLAAGTGAGGELATIERADGGLQVTYNGMPLYYWKDDKAPGDTTGQGVGEVWYVAAP